MATTFLNDLRRFAGFVFTLLLTGVCLCVGAAGQAPLVTSSVVNGLPPLTAPAALGSVWNTAASSRGDFLLADFENAALYRYPANGAAEVTLLAAPNLGPGGGYANNGIALDPWNNIWLDNNWNGGLQRIPYNAATGTWNVSAGATITAGLGSIGGGYFQSAGMAINSSGTFVLSTENSAPQPALFSFTIDASGNITNEQTVIATLTGRARTLSIDNAGNIFIWEDNGIADVLEVPAGTVGLADDKSLVHVDPTIIDPASGKPVSLLTNMTGTAVDAAGNLYVGDSSAGVFMVPNQAGTLNPAAWVMITPAPAAAQISIDPARDTLYEPIPKLWNGLANFATVSLGNGETGSSAVGKLSTVPITVYYSFAGPVTPAAFVIQEDGVTNPDFSIVSGGTCVVGTTYPVPATASVSAVTDCTVQVAVNPHTAGSVSGQLLMQTSATVNKQTVYTTVASTTLHGIGLGASIEATPAWESVVGGSLKTPSQVAIDVMGNLYIADAGLGKVLLYAAGSGASSAAVSVGTGLTAPTGVAVDGAGDIFIADSGNVLEVPNGPSGLNAAAQAILVSGLGVNLRLAADGLGHIYVADPADGQVVELYNPGGSAGPFGQSEVLLTSGFTQPSDVAVDSNNNLYVIDGSNLFEISGGITTTLLSNLSNASAVAVDPSGAVYVSSSGGTVRIPYVSGALVPASQTAIATTVTHPTGMAIDNMGNVYLADATALNLHLVSASGSLNFGNVPLGAQPSLNATVTNDGNAPLTVTGYASTNAIDYTGADGSCISGSPIAPAGICQVDVTLAPGPGQQNTLTGQIQIQSNSANAPIVVNATGVGAPLATSTISTATVASSAEVVDTPITVTVAPKNGAIVPTGQVTVTFTTITGAKGTASGTLKNGSVTLNLAPVAAGNATFTVVYIGDRVYGSTTTTTTAAVAKSAIAAITLPSSPAAPIYILESDGGTPYDGSALFWEYNFKVQVSAAAGVPTGPVTFMDTYQAGASSTTTTGPASAGTQHSGSAFQTLDPTGSASFPTEYLPIPQAAILGYTAFAWKHVITPVYSGDANFLTSNGSQATTFIVVASPAVQICLAGGVCTATSAPPSLSVSAGSSVSANLTLTPMLGYGFAGRNQQLNDYNFPVTLACSNLPPHATCSFNYPNPDASIATAVDINCQANITAAEANEGAPFCTGGLSTVTINTDVAAGTTTTGQLIRSTPIALAAMFGFGMVGLFFRRRAAQRAGLFPMLCVAVLGCALAVSLTACNTTNLSPASVLSTPSGTYPVTVTAQQVGSQCLVIVGAATDCTTAGGQLGLEIYGSQNQVSLPFTINLTIQ